MVISTGDEKERAESPARSSAGGEPRVGEVGGRSLARRADTGSLGASLLLTLACTSVLLIGDFGFYWRDDNQTQHVPASKEVFERIRSGDLPHFSQRSWMASELGGEYIYGVFSLYAVALDVAVWALHPGVREAALLLVLVPTLILAAGAFLLARSYDVSRPLAVLAAPLVAQGGWLVAWAGTSWLPALQSFAFLPWAWLFFRRAVTRSGVGSLVWGGISAYLVLAAGWPHTCLMMALVAAALVVERIVIWWRERAAGARELAFSIARLAVCWIIGLALAAPALLLFFDYGRYTVRMGMSWSSFTLDNRVPLSALAGVVLPSISPTWTLFRHSHPHLSVEFAGLLLPVLGLLPLRRRTVQMPGGSAAAVAMIAVAAGILMMAPSFGPFRWSFRWLPLFGLAVVLLGLRRLSVLLRLGEAPTVPLVGAIVVAITWVGSMLVGWDDFAVHHVVAATTLTMMLFWLWSSRKVPRWSTAAVGGVALIPLMVVLKLAWPQHVELPRWLSGDELLEPGLFEPARTYLGVYSWDDMFAEAPRRTGLRIGNQGMLAGLNFVNGYSSMRKVPLAEVFGFGVHGDVHPQLTRRLLATEAGPGGLLDLMGVDGIVLAPSFADVAPMLEASHWVSTGEVRGGRHFHRSAPGVRSVLSAVSEAAQLRPGVWVDRRFAARLGVLGGAETFGDVSVEMLRRRSARIEARVEGSAGEKAMIRARVPWSPYWRARLEGVELPVYRLDSVMAAIEIPPGSRGLLILEYSPSVLRRAALGTLFGTLLCALLIVADRAPGAGVAWLRIGGTQRAAR